MSIPLFDKPLTGRNAMTEQNDTTVNEEVVPTTDEVVDMDEASDESSENSEEISDESNDESDDNEDDDIADDADSDSDDDNITK